MAANLPPPTSYARSTTVQRRDRAGSHAVLVPTGAVEQHGPHLPLGVDTWIATELCHRTAAAVGAAVTVAEPLGYGCSWHHTNFPGTVSLSPATFMAVLTEVCAGLGADGSHVVVINGHGGNRAPIQTAMVELAAQGVSVWSVSYFELLGDVATRRFDDPRPAGHACALETSIMQHLWPELVDTAAIPSGGSPQVWPDQHMFGGDPVRTVRPFEKINPTGVIGRPELADPEIGFELVETAVDRLAEVVRDVLTSTESAR